MATRNWLIGAICVLPLVLGCDRSSRVDETPADEGTVLESREGEADEREDGLVMAGQLRSIDPDKRTMIVAFGDDLYEFRYDDETEIAGAASSVQGLAGKSGTEVTVHYRENAITSTKTAEKIELQ